MTEQEKAAFDAGILVAIRMIFEAIDLETDEKGKEALERFALAMCTSIQKMNSSEGKTIQ